MQCLKVRKEKWLEVLERKGLAIREFDKFVIATYGKSRIDGYALCHRLKEADLIEEADFQLGLDLLQERGHVPSH